MYYFEDTFSSNLLHMYIYRLVFLLDCLGSILCLIILCVASLEVEITWDFEPPVIASTVMKL